MTRVLRSGKSLDSKIMVIPTVSQVFKDLTQLRTAVRSGGVAKSFGRIIILRPARAVEAPVLGFQQQVSRSHLGLKVRRVLGLLDDFGMLKQTIREVCT